MSGSSYTNGVEDGREQMRKEMEAQLADKQFRIDSLMLEYCPEDMSTNQLDRWAKCQRAVVEDSNL